MELLSEAAEGHELLSMVRKHEENGIVRLGREFKYDSIYTNSQPLSFMSKKISGYKLQNDKELTHLFFVDDLKHLQEP